MSLETHLNKVLGCRCETGFSPPVEVELLLTVSRWYFFYELFVFFCLVYLMLSRLFISNFRSPARKGLTCWLFLVMFIDFLLLSHVVSWVRCGILLFRFLIFAIFLTLINFTFISILAVNIRRSVGSQCMSLAGPKVSQVASLISH